MPASSSYAHERPEEASLLALHAKAHLAEIGTTIVRTATEVHGGIGFTDEYDLHLWSYQLPEDGYVAMPLLGVGNQPSSAWCIRPGRPRSMFDPAVGAAGRPSECGGLNISE
jgi:hypothetical protein